MTERMTLALLRVTGRARTKGSLNGYCLKNKVHTVRMVEEVAESKAWRRRMAVAVQRDSRARHGTARFGYGLAVEVRAIAYLPRQLSVAQGVEPGTVVPSHATPFPTDIKMGDTDKLQRNIGDALVDAGLITDDSLITDWVARKRWAPLQSPAWLDLFVLEANDPDAPALWMPQVVA